MSENGLQPTEEKVMAMKKAERPRDTKTLRAFLGLINYYGKFMAGLSNTLAPLYDLLKKGKEWIWEEQQEAAFQQAKDQLSSDACLTHYDPKLQLVLSTDASSTGLGAILSHRWPDGTERPVSFASRKLSKTEVAYSQIEKEGLAIMFGMVKFHHYIFGRQFILLTDHRPLVHIFGPKNHIPTARCPASTDGR
jgi:hypothetical protein